MSPNPRTFIVGGIIFFFIVSLLYLFYAWIFNSECTTKFRNYIFLNLFLLIIGLGLYISLLIFGRGISCPSPMSTVASPPVSAANDSTPTPSIPFLTSAPVVPPLWTDEEFSSSSSSSSTPRTKIRRRGSKGVYFCSKESIREDAREPSTTTSHSREDLIRIATKSLRCKRLDDE